MSETGAGVGIAGFRHYHSVADVSRREAIERFLRGELSGSERALLVRHLLAGCESCAQAARRFWGCPEGHE